jgi:hypothetical protein
MPSPQYTIQDWNDAGEGSPTPIWADQADAGAGPSLQHAEEGIYNAHADALSAHTLATAAIPKPSSPSTDQVLQWNGSAWIAAKIDGDNVLESSIPVTKLTPGTTNQVIRTVGGVAVWQDFNPLPLRTVIGFHMDSGSEPIPAGWAVCNGQTVLSANHDLGGGDYVMPDFRNRFILGADPATAVGNGGNAADAPTDAPGPKGVGGSQLRSTVDIADTGSGQVVLSGSGATVDERPRFYGVVYIMKVKNV